MPIFRKKTSILPKILCSCSIFFQIFLQRTNGDAHFLSNKDQLCQNFTILWAKKLDRIPLFPILHGKKTLLSCPYFSKKTSFSKKQYALMPIFRQNNVHSLKITVVSGFFYFIIFHEKRPAIMPVFGNKNLQILSKLLCIIGQKSQ